MLRNAWGGGASAFPEKEKSVTKVYKFRIWNERHDEKTVPVTWSDEKLILLYIVPVGV